MNESEAPTPPRASLDDRRRSIIGWCIAGSILGVAAFLHLYRIGAVPSASGDEGNWMGMALRISRGQPTRLGPDARFVTLAFARLIAISYRLCGASIASARVVPALAIVLGIASAYALASSLRLRRAGCVLAALVAVHPWGMLWGRTVIAPYALAWLLAIAGPLAWLRALRGDDDSRTLRYVWFLVAGQLLIATLHFTPLGVIPVIACAVFTCLDRGARRSLGTRPLWFGVAAMAVHAAPILFAISSFARGRVPVAPRFIDAADRLRSLATAMLDALSGEGTLRDCVGDRSAMALTCVRVATGATVALLVVSAALAARDAKESATRDLARFAGIYSLVACVGVPLILMPARDWWLPTTESDRYGFAWIAPAGFLLASAAASRRRSGAMLAGAVVAWLAFGPTARASAWFFRGGGPDRGAFTALDGGGYRGFKVARGPRSLTEELVRTCRDAANGSRMTIAFHDYVFHPVRVLLRLLPEGNIDSIYLGDAPLTSGRLACFPVWSDGVLVRGYVPGTVVEQNDDVRATVRDRLANVRRVATWQQPNGSPLAEAYVGTVR